MINRKIIVFSISTLWVIGTQVHAQESDATVGKLQENGRALESNDKSAKAADNFARSADPKLKVVDVDFGPYMAALQRRIKRVWFPPKGEETKRPVALFKVQKNGQLTDLRVGKSSGSAAADQAALKAVNTAAPFPKLPDGAEEAVDIQFTFDYNVFTGRAGGVAPKGQ